MRGTDVERKMVGILRVLDGARCPMGATAIARELAQQGIELSERAVRYHLQALDERGLTRPRGRAGREITQRGREEVSDALVTEKVGFVATKISTLAYGMTFDRHTGKGTVILNVSLLPRSRFARALGVMKEVFRARLCSSGLVAIAEPGEHLGDLEVPAGHVGFGTVCSITINGILLREGVPVESLFGGLLELSQREPVRFTEIVSYEGSTIDPLEIFVKSELTTVRQAARTGRGKVGAGFREVPAVAKERATRVIEEVCDIGLWGVPVIGKPSESVLGIPVGRGRVGLVIFAGLNPLAAVEEAGVSTVNYAMSCLIDYRRLLQFNELLGRAR